MATGKASVEAYLDKLERVLGRPVEGTYERPHYRLWRFRCPVCRGGFQDPLWRPLIVTWDGRVWCQSSLPVGYERDRTCPLTPAAPARVLNQALALIGD